MFPNDDGFAIVNSLVVAICGTTTLSINCQKYALIFYENAKLSYL